VKKRIDLREAYNNLRRGNLREEDIYDKLKEEGRLVPFNKTNQSVWSVVTSSGIECVPIIFDGYPESLYFTNRADAEIYAKLFIGKKHKPRIIRKKSNIVNYVSNSQQRHQFSALEQYLLCPFHFVQRHLHLPQT